MNGVVPAGGLEVVARGVRLWLLPGRAAFCPESRSLLVADLHWGKAATFRAHGVPVPEGDLAAELARLAALATAVSAWRVVVVGDLVHARVGCTPELVDTVAAWRAAHPAWSFELVAGNHDVWWREPPPDWRLVRHDDGLAVGRLRFVHEPAAVPGGAAGGEALWVAGHLHPTAVLEAGGDRLRLPAHVLEDRVWTLPAFCAFSAGVKTRPARGRRLFVDTGAAVVEVRGA